MVEESEVVDLVEETGVVVDAEAVEGVDAEMSIILSLIQLLIYNIIMFISNHNKILCCC